MADAELSQEIAGDTIAGEEKRDRGPGLTLDEVIAVLVFGGSHSTPSGQVATHNSEQDCYIIIGNANNGGPKVYDVSKYLDDHPGGAEVILEVGRRREYRQAIRHCRRLPESTRTTCLKT